MYITPDAHDARLLKKSCVGTKAPGITPVSTLGVDLLQRTTCQSGGKYQGNRSPMDTLPSWTACRPIKNS